MLLTPLTWRLVLITPAYSILPPISPFEHPLSRDRTTEHTHPTADPPPLPAAPRRRPPVQRTQRRRGGRPGVQAAVRGRAVSVRSAGGHRGQGGGSTRGRCADTDTRIRGENRLDRLVGVFCVRSLPLFCPRFSPLPAVYQFAFVLFELFSRRKPPYLEELRTMTHPQARTRFLPRAAAENHQS